MNQIYRLVDRMMMKRFEWKTYQKVLIESQCASDVPLAAYSSIMGIINLLTSMGSWAGCSTSLSIVILACERREN